MYGILPGVKVTTSEPDLQDALSEGYTRKLLSGKESPSSSCSA